MRTSPTASSVAGIGLVSRGGLGQGRRVGTKHTVVAAAPGDAPLVQVLEDCQHILARGVKEVTSLSDGNALLCAQMGNYTADGFVVSRSVQQDGVAHLDQYAAIEQQCRHLGSYLCLHLGTCRRREGLVAEAF